MLFSAIVANAQISGGAYTITQSVTGNGGGTASGAGFEISGTSGQSLAFEEITTAPFVLRGGFWSPTFAPTAAGATISGRVFNLAGVPIKNAVITLTGGNLTAPRVTRTASFGYFTIENAEVGHIYVLSVSSKRYGFSQPSQTFMLTDNLSDIVFEANWEN